MFNYQGPINIVSVLFPTDCMFDILHNHPQTLIVEVYSPTNSKPVSKAGPIMPPSGKQCNKGDSGPRHLQGNIANIGLVRQALGLSLFALM